MWIQSIRVIVMSLIGCSLSSSALAQAANSPAPANVKSNEGWLTLRDCPVLLENAVEVPALESGVLEAVDVKLNQAIAAGGRLAKLDSSLAELELKISQMQSKLAQETADDTYDIQFKRLALKEIEEEKSSYESISSSVSKSEMARLDLNVERAKVAVTQALKAQEFAKAEAQLKAAALGAAQQRLQRRQILAPLAGVVTKLHKHPGQWVEAGQPIATISDLENLVVDSLVKVADFDRQQIVDAEVRLELAQENGHSVRLAGRVSSYDPEVSANGLVRVHTKVRNVQQQGQWLLLPGMPVTLHIAVPTKRQNLSRSPQLDTQR